MALPIVVPFDISKQLFLVKEQIFLKSTGILKNLKSEHLQSLTKIFISIFVGMLVGARD